MADAAQQMEPTPSSIGQHNGPFHCLEVFDVPPEFASGKQGVGSRDQQAVDKRILTSETPFANNQFVNLAPISLSEELLVLGFLFVTMGMPLFWFLLIMPWVLLQSALPTKFFFVMLTATLAFHPLPRIVSRQSKLVFALYKYFSYRLVWTGNLRERTRQIGPWVGAGAPHGVLPFANILSMAAVNSFSFLPADFKGAPASVVFNTPFLRYLTLLGPACGVSGKAIERELSNGCYVGIVPDGIAGIFCCDHSHEAVYLKNRKGLAKLALRTGCALIPCYSMGNTEAFTPHFDPFGVMEFLSRKTQASFFLYTGRFGLPLGIPRRTRITMLIGEPVIITEKKEQPTPYDVDEVHAKLLHGIRECFDLHKASLGWGHKEMSFV